MAGKQRVGGPVIVVVLVAALAAAYVVFNRAELAPPGVGIHEHAEEQPRLPWSPPVEAKDLQKLARDLMPLGVMAVFPPLSADRFSGVRIASVARGSPAERGGLRPGDLVKRFGEWDTRQAFALAGVLRRVEPGEEYEVVVVRGGKERTLVVTGVTPVSPEESALQQRAGLRPGGRGRRSGG